VISGGLDRSLACCVGEERGLDRIAFGVARENVRAVRVVGAVGA